MIADFATISFSGMGEPLLNLPAVAAAMRDLHEHTRSHLHVSTVGIVLRLADLFALEIPFSLDLSLHAATDDVRNKLMPVNLRYLSVVRTGSMSPSAAWRAISDAALAAGIPPAAGRPFSPTIARPSSRAISSPFRR